jgi:hypothetical protein
MMTAQEMGWLRGNPATLLDRRAVLPPSFAALLEAGPGWRLLYVRWLAEHHDVALPNFEKQAVGYVHDRLANPEHERDLLDEAFARRFSSSYKAFHEACVAVRVDLTGRIDAMVAGGADRQEAAATVGAAAATAAVGTALAAAGGTLSETLKGWTAGEAAKTGLAGAYKAPEKALSDAFFLGRHAEHAKGITDAAWRALRARADEVRAVVAEIEQRKPLSGGEDALMAALAAWTSAIQDTADAALITEDGARYDVSRWVEHEDENYQPELLDANDGVFLVSLRAVSDEPWRREVRLRLVVEDLERVRVEYI